MIADPAAMRLALGLAARGLGLVAPNPAVGCVIIRDGKIVGRGWTKSGGRPHAETEALKQAGSAARGATAFVTLEPCAHTGKTPPCADALISSGISRCVAAITDPDPRVSGGGLAKLRDAGIAVDLGLLAEEAASLNAGFLSRIQRNRPLITVKLATTLDARIATRTGQSQWITGTPARAVGHLLRYRHDAIMVGSGTALADDPELTVRLPGLAGEPKPRIVIDSQLRTPLTAKLVTQAKTIPTIVVTLAGCDLARRAALTDRGVDVIEVAPEENGQVDLVQALQHLAKRGFTRILVEGGAVLSASLLRLGLADRIAWFRSPGLIGGDGLAAIQPLGVEYLADQLSTKRLSFERVGEDILEHFAVIPRDAVISG